LLDLSLETVVDIAIDTAACAAKTFADIVAGTALKVLLGLLVYC